MERLRSLDSLSSTPTMRSNTAGGGPSIDSKATVGPSPAIANDAPGAPPLAQPPSAPAVANNRATQPARSSARRLRNGTKVDASLIVNAALTPKRGGV